MPTRFQARIHCSKVQALVTHPHKFISVANSLQDFSTCMAVKYGGWSKKIAIFEEGSFLLR
jgi:hypothetical protein